MKQLITSGFPEPWNGSVTEDGLYEGIEAAVREVDLPNEILHDIYRDGIIEQIFPSDDFPVGWDKIAIVGNHKLRVQIIEGEREPEREKWMVPASPFYIFSNKGKKGLVFDGTKEDMLYDVNVDHPLSYSLLSNALARGADVIPGDFLICHEAAPEHRVGVITSYMIRTAGEME